MTADRMEIREGGRYRHKWTGSLVRVKEVRDGNILWNTLDDYKIEGHTWGIVGALQFANDFDLIGNNYQLMKVG